jgi:hypothetical protein
LAEVLPAGAVLMDLARASSVTPLGAPNQLVRMCAFPDAGLQGKHENGRYQFAIAWKFADTEDLRDGLQFGMKATLGARSLGCSS